MTGSRQWHTDRFDGGGYLDRLRQRPVPIQVGIVAGIAVAALVLVSMAWIAITAATARSQLTAIRNDLSALREQIANGEFEAAIATADSISTHAGSAHQLTSGPAWWGGAQVPYVGKPIVSIRGIARAAHELSVQVLPQLVRISSDLQPSRLQVAEDQFNLDTLNALPGRLRPVLDAARQIDAGIDDLPRHTWINTVDYGRDSLASTVDDLVKFLDDASVAAGVADVLLGPHGLQRYFVGFLNGAETRGLGGLPGVFGILTADHGKVGFERFGTDDELAGVSSGLDFGADYTALYKQLSPTTQYLNSPVSPDFSYTARIWAAMYERKMHEHIDGALALDPTALSYLLAAAGPATVKGVHGTVNSGNVVQLTENIAYLNFDKDQKARKAYLQAVAAGVEAQVLRSHKNLIGLLKAAGQAATERRLMMWSEDPAVEKVLAGESVGNATPQTKAPFGRVVLNNYGANKLDYYLASSLQWKRTGCGPTRSVTVTITLVNQAPTEGLTPYMTNTKAGDPHAGDNKTLVDYHASAGARLQAATLNGTAINPTTGAELGHPVARVLVNEPVGSTQTLVLQFSEPAGDGSPHVYAQPMIKPMSLDVEDQSC